ncbi:hypothetical protein R6242_04365 [Iodobacter sp. CM08]|uniref:hypothetical protein n=1 Tax=Iodobacter sp. CM08 TaxID=3085902 RepID=UPI0029814467|nr:hypothetical protein [Iodobacter sp. CM08]MDW5415805.1 hypothetical protein [Iodobacter sp. CM08]
MKTLVQPSEVIYEEYARAIHWMESIGVKIDSSRASHYKRVVKYYNAECKNKPIDEKNDIFPSFVSSIFEIYGFIDVYNAFKEVPLDLIEPIVKKLQMGWMALVMFLMKPKIQQKAEIFYLKQLLLRSLIFH